MAKPAVELPIGYEERAQFCHNKVARDLLTLMERKKTNLAFSPDVTRAEELLRLAKAAGPHICILKTHIDLLQDFTPDVIKQLKELAKQHHFILFEDRQFSEVGSVAKEEYAGGLCPIADWASITNTRMIPGAAVIEALREVAQPKGNALVLEAESGSTKAAVQMAHTYPDFIMGFICQKRLVDEPGLLHITTGIDIGVDRTPEKAIYGQGHDIVMVGRGICEAADPSAAAQQYRTAAWKAYEKRLGTKSEE